MKLLSSWTRSLSIGITLWGWSNQVFGQGAPQPVPMPHELDYSSSSFAMAGPPPMGAGCDGYCGEDRNMCFGQGCGYQCGPGSNGFGGYAGCGPEGCDGMCGPGGCGGMCGPGGMPGDGSMGGMFGPGCGPLGCEGGTFGDGRSLSHLCDALSSRFCSLTKMILMPYGEGGVATQRWFDVSAEVTYFRRDNGAGDRAFSSNGLAPVNPSDFVLSTSDVELDDYRAGLGLQGNIQVGPGSNLELVYFGLNDWSETASVSSPNATLFSFFSDFGTDPFNGFDDSDRSLTHTISYFSDIDNGEINLRRRWAEPSGFFQGSFLAGIRYFELDEQFVFTATGLNNNGQANNGPRFFNYDTRTENELAGFQLGADLWLNVIPGIKVGTEVKGGIFGNHATQETVINANSLPGFGIPSIVERASDGRTAYLAQLSSQIIYRLTYEWTLRGSYQLLYIENVALAPENVNNVPPALFLPTSNRQVVINNDGEVFYTGFTGGVEYNW